MAVRSSTEIIVFSLSGFIVWYLFKYLTIFVYDSEDPVITVLKKLPIVHILTLILSVGVAALFTALDTCFSNTVQCALATMLCSTTSLIATFLTFKKSSAQQVQHVSKVICKACFFMLSASAFYSFPSTVCTSVALVIGLAVIAICDVADMYSS